MPSLIYAVKTQMKNLYPLGVPRSENRKDTSAKRENWFLKMFISIIKKPRYDSVDGLPLRDVLYVQEVLTNFI